MAEASHAVFLSYASQDAEAAARICAALRTAGVEVWFDQSELRGGDAWDRQIRKQIHDCALFIPVISAHSDARHEGYFRREWRLAVERVGDMAEDVPFLLPVVIDSTLDATARVPDRFREVQWLRVPDGQASAEFIERVQRLLWPEHAHAPTTVRPATGPASTPISTAKQPVRAFWRWVSALLATVAVMTIAALAYLAIDKFWISRQAASFVAGTAVSARSQPGGVPEKSIAVLPFTDMSEKHDQEYFADGMAEEVIDLLAKLPGLRVIGRTSSFQFRGKSLDVRAIGDALKVSYVLEGSVRRSGDRVRITAQLLSAQDGVHRWSDTYDAKLDDVLSVQDTIASNLARSLELAVGTSDVSGRRSESAEAYDLFMQGRQALDVGSKEACERAIGLFTHVTQLDPTSTRAWVFLARSYLAVGQQGWMPPKEAFEKARQFALRALQLEPNDGAAHVVLAFVHLDYDWDWAGAEKEIDTAFALGHRDAWTLRVAGQIASTRGEWSRAEQFVREGLAEDPMDSETLDVLGYWIYARQGRNSEAEAPLRRALELRPTLGSGRYFLAVCLLMQGRLEEALAEAQRELPEDGKYHVSSEALFAMHRKGESDEALKKAIKESESEWPVSIAKVYAYRGERDQAMVWLERAYRYRDEDLYFSKGDPQFRNLEADPRYKTFLRKMNLPE